MSGPVMDRIDMRVTVARLPESSFIKTECGESSNQVKNRIRECVDVQKSRFKDENISYNSEVRINIVNEWLKDNKCVRDLIYAISGKYNLTARGMVSILKVSRTIADLEESSTIEEHHIIEAVHYRVGCDNNQGSGFLI